MCSGLLPSSVKVCRSPLKLRSFGSIEFCPLVRVVAFAMRALLTKRETAGENFHFVLAQQIIYGIGFFGVLYSAYIMVIDRCDPYCIRGFPKR